MCWSHQFADRQNNFGSSSHNVSPILSGKAPWFSIFSDEGAQKEEVIFDQWVFEVSSALTNHSEATFGEGITDFSCDAPTDLVCYLGQNAPVSHMLNKLHLMYVMVASFDIIMQTFYRLQQAKTERIPVYITHLKEVLNVVWQNHPHMLSVAEIQSHLHDH